MPANPSDMADEEVDARSQARAVKAALQTSTAWKYTTSKLPENQELMATVSNGFLGHRLFSDTIYAAGVFNGDHLSSHRARIPATLPTKITIQADEEISNENSEERLYTLDARNAAFLQTITAADQSYVVQQVTYAHRHYKNLLITEVQAMTTREKGVSLTLENDTVKQSPDIKFTQQVLKGILHFHRYLM